MNCNRVTQPSNPFIIQDGTTPGTFSLRGGPTGKYCRNNGMGIICDSDTPEMFIGSLVDGFKSPIGQKFCSDNLGFVSCDRTAVGSWERWQEVPFGSAATPSPASTPPASTPPASTPPAAAQRNIAIKGGRGNKFCDADATTNNYMNCNRVTQPSNPFIIQDGTTPGTFSLRGGPTGKYCRNNGMGIICDSDTPEMFIGSLVDGFKSPIGQKFCSDNLGFVSCDRTAVGSWERWQEVPFG